MKQHGNFTVMPCGNIEGLFEITPTVYGDARGYFMETYQKEDFKELGIEAEFVQDNQSSSKFGVLRGIHFQKKYPQAKLVRVFAGKIFDVAVDLRPSSETFGCWYGTILSDENKKQLYVPEGFGHGFFVLSETAVFSYKCSDYYHPEAEDGLLWNEKAIQIDWPVPEGVCPLVAEKDRKYKPFERILITGADGQLGKALAEQFAGRVVALLRHEDCDITDRAAVFAAAEKYRPTIILNAAAFTAVDRAETEDALNRAVNTAGAGYLAEAAQSTGAKLVHISTDYVFDGTKGSPYTEEDETSPANCYGAAKLAGEELVKKNCEKSFILRIAWVYGDGKNFVQTMLRLAKERGADGQETKINPLRVVSDQWGTPTSTKVIARAISGLLQTEAYGTYHAACSGITNWYEFASEIMKLAGKDIPVEAITTAEYPTPAKRPFYSVLDHTKLDSLLGYCPPDWRAELTEYLHTID